jgi:hypothetical protein
MAGWSVTTAHARRAWKWRHSSRATDVNVDVSFFFDNGPRRPDVVFAVQVLNIESPALNDVRDELRALLGDRYSVVPGDTVLSFVLRDAPDAAALAELRRIRDVFDGARVRRVGNARASSRTLGSILEAIRRTAWPMMAIGLSRKMQASTVFVSAHISVMSDSASGRPGCGATLFASSRRGSRRWTESLDALERAAASRRYEVKNRQSNEIVVQRFFASLQPSRALNEQAWLDELVRRCSVTTPQFRSRD